MAGVIGRRTILTVGATLACVLPAAPAAASNHKVKVKEVLAGTTAHATSQFIELQLYANGENLFAGTHVRVYGPGASIVPVADYTLTTTLAGASASQATYLLATAQAQTDFGVTADFTMPSASLDPAGGRVCYISASPGFTDCVAWGDHTGMAALDESPAGTAFQAGTGLGADQVMVRRTAGASKPCALEAGDDTDDSATDFMVQAGAPRPQPNSVAPQPVHGCARVVGDQMRFDAAPGVENNVEFKCFGPEPCGTLADSQDDVAAGDGCWPYAHDKAACPPEGYSSAKLSGHDGRDKLDNGGVAVATDDVPTTIIGGSGNDTLFSGGNGADVLKGGDGNDKLDAVDGFSANDTLNCDAGSDLYRADPGDIKKDCESKWPR